MKLATIRGGGRDGTLVVVDSRAGLVSIPSDGPRTLQSALEDWEHWEPVLAEAADRLVDGTAASFPVDSVDFRSPLPRSYHWCEGSTYLAHMERIRKSRGIALPPGHGVEPVGYQTGSSGFLGPTDDIPLVDVELGLDIEGTIAIITDDVPVGTKREDAASHIKLVVLANDLTYRNLLPQEYAKNVGFYQSKPERSFAPFAVTPDSLGSAWSGLLLESELRCSINGVHLGHPNTAVDVSFDFGRMIEFLTLTRPLNAGSLVGSGTVSNRRDDVGYTCLAELRAVELTNTGEFVTPYLVDGDVIDLEAFIGDDSVFGAIRQRVSAV